MAVLTAADDDAALGAALKVGDAEGIAALYQKYKHPIYEFAARVLDDPDRAQDIAQMTFLRTMEHRATLHDPAHVRKWLYSIALNLCRDELTKSRESRHAQLVDTVPASDPEPETAALQHSNEELVWATSYVAASRTRDASYVFTDYSSLRMETHDRDQALKELAARASESQAKVSALDVIEKHQARTEDTTTRATATRPKHELGTPRPTACGRSRIVRSPDHEKCTGLRAGLETLS